MEAKIPYDLFHTPGPGMKEPVLATKNQEKEKKWINGDL